MAEVVRQRPAAVAALSDPFAITVAVIVEFEWVMRGFYGLKRFGRTSV